MVGEDRRMPKLAIGTISVITSTPGLGDNDTHQSRYAFIPQQGHDQDQGHEEHTEYKVEEMTDNDKDIANRHEEYEGIIRIGGRVIHPGCNSSVGSRQQVCA
jgi:hypothetical protein